MKRTNKDYVKIGKAVEVQFPYIFAVVDKKPIIEDVSRVPEITKFLMRISGFESWGELALNDQVKFKVSFALSIVNLYCPESLSIEVPVTYGLNSQISQSLGMTSVEVSKVIKLYRQRRYMYREYKDTVKCLTNDLSQEFNYNN